MTAPRLAASPLLHPPRGLAPPWGGPAAGGLAHRGVEGSGDQVLEHVLLVAEQAGVDGDALDVVLAGHDDLDQSGARFAADFDQGELVLRLLQVVLHLLRLLHQAGQLSLVEHGGSL